MPSTLRMIPEISFKTDRITFGFFENICVQGSVVVVEVATRLLRLCYTMCQLHCKRRAKFNPKVGRLDGKILNGSTASTVSIHGTATRGSKWTKQGKNEGVCWKDSGFVESTRLLRDMDTEKVRSWRSVRGPRPRFSWTPF